MNLANMPILTLPLVIEIEKKNYYANLFSFLTKSKKKKIKVSLAALYDNDS